MSGRDYDLVDRETGQTVITVRHLWPDDPCECCMCDKLTFSDKAVPYYCGPVREGQSEGGYKTACDDCYAKWERWNDSFPAEQPQGKDSHER